MHRILYFGGLASGAVMLILSILIWFKLGIRKAFRDVLNYGSKGKWLVDQKMLNKTMPLRKTDSGRIITGTTVKKTTNNVSINNHGDTYETILLENYHGQMINNNIDVNFEIIEEINLIAGGR